MPGAKHAHKGRIVGRKNNANAEGTADEENTESPVNLLEGILERLAGFLGFTGTCGDVLGTDDDESSLPQCAQKSLETAQVASREILYKGKLFFFLPTRSAR